MSGEDTVQRLHSKRHSRRVLQSSSPPCNHSSSRLTKIHLGHQLSLVSLGGRRHGHHDPPPLSNIPLCLYGNTKISDIVVYYHNEVFCIIKICVCYTFIDLEVQ